MNGNGWIALSRKLLSWQWRDEPKMVALWVHILLRACHESIKYHGITIQRGQFATSTRALAVDVGLTVKEIRLYLKRLIAEDSITVIYPCRAYSIVCVTNYDQYQRFGDIAGLTQRAHLNDCNSSVSDDNANEKGTERAHQKDVKAKLKENSKRHFKEHQNDTQKGTQRAHLTNCVSEPPKSNNVINCTQNSTPTATESEAETDTNTTPKTEGEGHNNNNNTVVPPPHTHTCARESEFSPCPLPPPTSVQAGPAPAAPFQHPLATPPTTVQAGPAPIPASQAAAALGRVLSSEAYAAVIYLRSKMPPEEVPAYIPEFAAQCLMKQKQWRDERDLTEHFASWLQKKQIYLNEQHRTATPGGADSPAARAERERERHCEVIQTALGLMAGSSRDD